MCCYWCVSLKNRDLAHKGLNPNVYFKNWRRCVDSNHDNFLDMEFLCCCTYSLQSHLFKCPTIRRQRLNLVGRDRFELSSLRLRAVASPSKFTTHIETHFALTFTSDYPACDVEIVLLSTLLPYFLRCPTVSLDLIGRS